MDVKLFVDALNENNINFFTGVPDSLLGVLCDELVNRYGTDGGNHIVAHNEGGCVALAGGYHLASGSIPCVYMQNSGIGNAANPIASLTHPKVYGIPMLFIIGWRGEPGTKDEPQHVFQGEITLKLLKDMEIEYFIVDKTTMLADVESVLKGFSSLFAEGKSAAFVIRKGTFSGNNHSYHNSYTLNREEAIGITLEAASSDPIISTTGKISRELFEIRHNCGEGHERDFLTVGSMGHSVMIALGIAMQQPKRRIWCLDGDGAVLMHMGSMALVGNYNPEKFIHIVFNNEAHETVGGMPTAAKSIDLPSIAKACGYCHVFRATNAESLETVLAQAKTQQGPVFIEVQVALGSRLDLGRPTTTTAHNKLSFMNFLNKGD